MKIRAGIGTRRAYARAHAGRTPDVPATICTIRILGIKTIFLCISMHPQPNPHFKRSPTKFRDGMFRALSFFNRIQSYVACYFHEITMSRGTDWPPVKEPIKWAHVICFLLVVIPLI